MSNIWSGHGNLARDPEVRVLGNERAVCNFTINAGRKYRGSDGNERKVDCWMDCEAWGKTGEIIAKHFQKGDPIHVYGKVKSEKWQDKSGNSRTSMKCEVDSFEFCGGRRHEGEQPVRQARQSGEYQDSGPTEEEPPF